MSYNYKDTIDSEPASYQDRFLEYANNWEDDKTKEKKRVKIIKVIIYFSFVIIFFIKIKCFFYFFS